MSKILYVKSSELREGDVVLTHGLRVLIDQEIKDYPGIHGDVFHTNGRVVNLEEAKADSTIYVDRDNPGVIPLSWLYPDVFRGGWTKDWDADPRWVIQGNDNATWCVEREV
ncbi:hypothetical protein PP460_gp056 [Streptomyces phage Muntaha]|uniref:Uncharacterized protein n=1 Tax=Streptomyces phage Muntaha TaxID=2713269 RepID=A0A6G8R3K6_9CAUD|nr:hypothetical protein PP460_gp056 [Streptomyces phage Muntaha]QIN94746.1 hypothetical protein SEA_MUNTAHA_222 [Streptomyces phage Muntaha]